MIIELRQKSQVTIPAECTKLLSLTVGDKFEVVVKDGALVLIPVTVYPKQYVENLETELTALKKQIAGGKHEVFNNLDDMFNSLDKE